MKIHSRQSSGSILTVMLVAIVLIGITLASYLSLVANQNLSIVRSQQWNSALPIAEAGVEEAMAQLNSPSWVNHEALLNNIPALAARILDDGWQVEGTNVVKERYIGKSKYRAFINKDLDPPIILSQGYVQIPMKEEFIEPPRTVRVGTTNEALFSKGMVAKGQIDLMGNNIMTDSFDSSDPAYSTNGRYDPDKTKDNGDVATNSSVIDSLNVWNAEIYGRASTGPGGTVRIGANGSVGSKSWHEEGKKGIEPGYATDDMNVHLPDVKLPYTGGAFTPASNVNVGGTNYTYLLAGGNYQLSSLSLSGQQKVLVTGDSVLVVSGNVSLTGNAYILLAPGAKLAMYVDGSSASIGGNGIMNSNSDAMSFSYWGTAKNTSVSMSGNASFTGTIYAPYAQLTLGGGGNNNYDLVGGVVANTVKMNGHYNFHYDEALGKRGYLRGYTIISWNETTSWEEI